MKIEHFFYGMIDGKITLLKTTGVSRLLQDKTFQRLRELREADSDIYLWLPTEQAIALPHITKVYDKAGREFIQNHTLLIGIHDYLRLTNPKNLLLPFILSPFQEVPETFEPIKVTA